jgi:hypothetical protein
MIDNKLAIDQHNTTNTTTVKIVSLNVDAAQIAMDALKWRGQQQLLEPPKDNGP